MQLYREAATHAPFTENKDKEHGQRESPQEIGISKEKGFGLVFCFFVVLFSLIDIWMLLPYSSQ